MSDKLQKQICRTFAPALAIALEPLPRCRNAASTSLFCRYYFGRGSSELVELVPLPYFCGRSTGYSNRLLDFYVTIPRSYKGFYVNSFFPRTARLLNSFSAKCFPLTYDLNSFKSRVNRHLSSLGAF